MGISLGELAAAIGEARCDVNSSNGRKNADVTRISRRLTGNFNLVFTLNLKTPAGPKSRAGRCRMSARQ
jgi:hypothetical protein